MTHEHSTTSGVARGRPALQAVGDQPRILIIGAGMSGILMAIKLKESGYTRICIYEKADRPGGAWRDNTYPGLKCDVPAPMFTYSFEPNPEYSTRFPLGAEIRSYLGRVYDKYGVGKFVRFNKAVESVNYEHGRWFVQTAEGETEMFDVVIFATGILHQPRFPDIQGMEAFRGVSFHTARWNHAIDLADKSIGVIGTGATAVQVVPELLRIAKKVTLFQRTPQWIFPMPNKTYSPAERERMRQSPNLVRRLRQRYSTVFRHTFTRAVVGNRLLLWAIEALCKRHLKRKVKDPELRRKMTPTFRAGCKRLIFDKGFYQSLQQPKAVVETSAIARIEPAGVRSSDGTLHALDVIIYATGYHAHNYMRPIKVIGRDRKSIDTTWKDGAYAHRSTSVPGFPNLFMVFGPYSPIGNYSAISVAEVQVEFILQQLRLLRDTGYDLIEPDATVTERLTEQMDRAMKRTVWTSGCASWYTNDSGRTPMWPWNFERYEREMARIRPCEFHLTMRPQPSETSYVVTFLSRATAPGIESNAPRDPTS